MPDKLLLPPDIIASIIGKLRIIDREMNRHSAATREAVGLKYTEGLFLRIVAAMPGIRLNAVAKQMMLSQGASSNLKRTLVHRGLIEERPDDIDRRAVCLHATYHGYHALERGKRTVQSPLRTAAEELSRSEILQLDYLLGRVTNRVEEINALAATSKAGALPDSETPLEGPLSPSLVEEANVGRHSHSGPVLGLPSCQRQGAES